jgi:hypothetical protein
MFKIAEISDRAEQNEIAPTIDHIIKNYVKEGVVKEIKVIENGRKYLVTVKYIEKEWKV